MNNQFEQEDPFKKYGGQEDPFKKYGGNRTSPNDNGWWKKPPVTTEPPKQDTPKTGGDPKDIKSYPPCVQKFGNPTQSPGGEWSISEVWIDKETNKKYANQYYNNGKYLDTKYNNIFKYYCKGDRIWTDMSDDIPSGSTKSPSVTKPKPKGMHYTPCTNLPCQFGTKNSKIREIQTCLGFPLKWQTGNFGPITRKGLKDLQYDISKGITDEIYNTIKQNCGASKSSTPDHPPLNPSGNNPATDNPQPEFKDQDQLGVGRQ